MGIFFDESEKVTKRNKKDQTKQKSKKKKKKKTTNLYTHTRILYSNRFIVALLGSFTRNIYIIRYSSIIQISQPAIITSSFHFHRFIEIFFLCLGYIYIWDLL